MTHVTCRLTAKNRDQFWKPTLGNRVWATFTFLQLGLHCEIEQVWQHGTARICPPLLQQSIDISCPEGARQRTCSSGFAAVGPWGDSRTDACSAYYVTNATAAAVWNSSGRNYTGRRNVVSATVIVTSKRYANLGLRFTVRLRLVLGTGGRMSCSGVGCRWVSDGRAARYCVTLERTARTHCPSPAPS